MFSEDPRGVALDRAKCFRHASSVVPLIGRERELAILDEALCSAAAGRGHCVALIGEAGIGKTRLADECTQRATAANQRTAWGSAWSEAAPFWPWQDVLRQLGENETASRLDGGGPGTSATTAHEYFEVYRSVVDAVISAASNQPVLLVLDDVHLADLPTLRLSRFVARSLRSTSATLLLTSRAPTDVRGVREDVSDALFELLATADAIVVEGLGLESIRALLLEQLHTKLPLSRTDAMAHDLAQLTGGNPLLIGEAIAGGLLLEPTATVERVGRLLRHRLDGLDETDRKVLAAGAVLGPTATVHELAEVSGLPSERVRQSLKQATRRGLITGARDCVFAHGLLRETFVQEIGADDVCALQERCAEVLDPGVGVPRPEVDVMTRVAKFRLSVAQHLGGESVDRAVQSTRRAVNDNLRRYGAAATAPMLHQLMDLVEGAGRRVPEDLLVELGTAELAGGNVAQARRRFDQAIDGTDDPAVFTRAVLGRGDLAVFEHRSLEELVELERLVEIAHTRIDGIDDTLRLRLEVLSARERWLRRRGRTDAVSAAVDAVRSCGDATATAHALLSLHHVLLGPQDRQRRKEIADELLALAPRLGDAFLALNGSMWRVVGLFLAGDAAATRALRELRNHADAVQARSVLIAVARIDVMLLIRSGQFEVASDSALLGFEQACEFGDADAFGYYAGHLMAIEWIRGRSDELLDVARLAVSQPTLVDGDEIYTAGLAALCAQAGGSALADAAAELDRIEAIGFDNVPLSSNWLVTMQCLGEAAIVLDRRDTCAMIRSLLDPYTELPVMGSMGTICVGSVARIVGLLELACGRVDRAIEMLDRAHLVAQRLEDRPFVAIGAGELALALMRRGTFEDSARSAALLEAGHAAMLHLGMDRRADQLAHAHSRIMAAQATRRYVRRTTSGWEFLGAQETAILPNAKGFEYLARLIGAPNVDIAADDLAGTSIVSKFQELWDEAAIGALRKQALHLKERIENADAAGDPVESERAQSELAVLVRAIGADTQPDGSSRSFGDTRERARTAVTKAIARAIGQLAEQAPTLAAELRSSLHTGGYCRYEQNGSVKWVLDDARTRKVGSRVR